jgi:iron complex transport system ATP-binding protein
MLEAHELRYCIGPQELLRGVSLRARPGEVLAVVGANGAGKSTLLKLLSGELAPAAGTVCLDGRPLAAYRSGDLARRRAVLSQQVQVALPFTSEELVLMGRYPHFEGAPRRQDHEIGRRALAQVGITELAGRAYATLSGGEQQRVQLARLLAQVLDVPGACLLLDEPTNHLDLRHQHDLLRLARELAGRGYLVVTILHDLNLAAQYADRVLMLRRGEVVAAGTPAEVLTPAHIRQGFGIEVRCLVHPELACPLVVPTGFQPISVPV